MVQSLDRRSKWPPPSELCSPPSLDSTRSFFKMSGNSKPKNVQHKKERNCLALNERELIKHTSFFSFFTLKPCLITCK